MTWSIKVRGALAGPVSAEYRCPVHGVFEVVVERAANGEPPDVQPCRFAAHLSPALTAAEARRTRYDVRPCGLEAPWTITSAPAGRVRAVEVVRGKAEEKPHPYALDTRALAEGASPSEFREQRARMWNDYEYKRFKERR